MLIKRTIDHDEIRSWAAKNGGRPAIIRETEGVGFGVLTLLFEESKPNAEEISWPEFFRMFEEQDLALVFQEQSPQHRFERRPPNS